MYDCDIVIHIWRNRLLILVLIILADFMDVKLIWYLSDKLINDVSPMSMVKTTLESKEQILRF
jgi:hypothetical protein